jgi:hypothetical protein
MSWGVGFEPTTLAFERAKTFHALERAATLIGYHFTNLSVLFKNQPLRQKQILIKWGSDCRKVSYLDKKSILHRFKYKKPKKLDRFVSLENTVPSVRDALTYETWQAKLVCFFRKLPPMETHLHTKLDRPDWFVSLKNTASYVRDALPYETRQARLVCFFGKHCLLCSRRTSVRNLTGQTGLFLLKPSGWKQQYALKFICQKR